MHKQEYASYPARTHLEGCWILRIMRCVPTGPKRAGITRPHPWAQDKSRKKSNTKKGMHYMYLCTIADLGNRDLLWNCFEGCGCLGFPNPTNSVLEQTRCVRTSCSIYTCTNVHCVSRAVVIPCRNPTSGLAMKVGGGKAGWAYAGSARQLRSIALLAIVVRSAFFFGMDDEMRVTLVWVGPILKG